jgi:hypothetical protein
LTDGSDKTSPKTATNLLLLSIPILFAQSIFQASAVAWSRRSGDAAPDDESKS